MKIEQKTPPVEPVANEDIKALIKELNRISLKKNNSFISGIIGIGIGYFLSSPPLNSSGISSEQTTDEHRENSE
ncbi:hypothetical protein GCM10027442_41240 [Emticicia fontis]